MSEASKHRELHVVVLDTETHEEIAGIAGALADAFAAASDSERGRPSQAPPSPLPQEQLLREADAAVALDPPALERAREMGIPFCAVVLPGFDTAWAGSFDHADCIVVAHEAQIPALVAKGVPEESIEVAGPVPPTGYVPAADRAALRAEHGPGGDRKLVLVPATALDEEGANALLVQLSLVAGDVAFLFHVGGDVATAEALRRVVPAHEVTGYMFADTPESIRYWQIADVVLAHARWSEVNKALGVGAPLVLLPPGRTDRAAVSMMESCGIAVAADAMATLAVTIDTALADDRLAAARSAIGALDPTGAAGRVAKLVRGTWRRQRDAGRLLPRGLPVGLERLPDSPRVSSLPPSPERAPEEVDFDAKVEAELAELKKRLKG